MNKPDINYAKIDPGIRGLVRILNQIPFVATLDSCEGHLKAKIVDTRYDEIKPDKGHKFLYGGFSRFFYR